MSAAVRIRGLFEVAIQVAELERAEAFYREVLGLAHGLRDERRRWTFLRVGGAAGMLVLQENRGAWPKQHFAFTVDAADLDAAAKVLASREVVTTGPVHHAWIPGRSLYFSDPDGHELELFAATPA